ncbi:MAG: hypothetical protein P4M01_09080 [Acidobacteriota bacterium]|nr:hypothetical protein [Acidobacteriota bacterium]
MSLRILLFAMRAALALYLSDILSMAVMNAGCLPTAALPWIYAFLLAAAWLLTRRLTLPERHADGIGLRQIRNLTLGAIVFSLLLAGLRAGYLLEVPLHRLVPVLGDDLWHIPELSSLVNSTGYPAESSLQPGMYFSMYYASWMLPAALYKALPLSGVTIKAVLFAANLIYLLAGNLALLYMAVHAAKTRRQLNWSVYLTLLWAGPVSLISIVNFWHHNGWWLNHLGLNLQYSPYAVACIWVIHHVNAGIALVAAAYLWKQAQTPWHGVCCGLLLGFGSFSSVFVFLGAIPFILLMAWQSRGGSPRVLAAGAASFLLVLFPLFWLYLNKPTSVSFLVPMIHPLEIGAHSGHTHHYPYLIGLVIFLAVIAVQFAGCTWVLLDRGIKLKRGHYAWLGLAMAYLLSTYFVGFSFANNYCTRGMIVPSLVLTWIAASYLPSPPKLLLPVLALLALGSIQEYAYQARLAWYGVTRAEVNNYAAQMTYDETNTERVLQVNRDRSRTRVDARDYMDCFNPLYRSQDFRQIEKLSTVAPEELMQPDRELLSAGPVGPWRWMRNPTVEQRRQTAP